MTKQEEFELYGKYLDGTETELELQKLSRIRYLKLKMRDRLAADIGDDPDALTDVLRCVLIAQGINLGIVTDADIIARHAQYIGEMLVGYGGAENITDVLEYDKDRIGYHVMLGYFVAKSRVDAAETVEDVMLVDLP
jgi:hypothetical protein